MQIRSERPEDLPAIRDITAAAFAPMPYSTGAEPRIINALRESGALTLSLVADRHGEVLGHVAFSPVAINGEPGDWYGLGPVAVSPPYKGLRIGKALIEEGLDRLREMDAGGCVLLGDPPVKGALVISGMYDLHAPMLSARAKYVKITPEELDAASAMRHLGRIRCPVAVAWSVGDSPEFRRQAQVFAWVNRINRRLRHRHDRTPPPSTSTGRVRARRPCAPWPRSRHWNHRRRLAHAVVVSKSR